MIYSQLVKKACNICFEAHKEQKDKGGYPYVFHPFYLAMQMDDEYCVCTALLHDVIEDHGDRYSIESLKKEGFPGEVIDALKLLTLNDGSSYKDYVKRIKSNPIATKVKIADLKHNLISERLEGSFRPPKYDLYVWALEYLESK